MDGPVPDGHLPHGAPPCCAGLGDRQVSLPRQIDEESALHLSRLPPLHRVPFDRILHD
jgi:hypothetical protein